MNSQNEYAVSSLMESVAREDFAINLYTGQLLNDPFAEPPLTPYYYVLDGIYFLGAGPVKIGDLSGVIDIESIHRRQFMEAARQLNPRNDPVPRIEFPPDLFDAVTVPETPVMPGMKTALRIAVTDIVQEERAKLIYNFFMKQTEGWVRELYGVISFQEGAHRKIFEKILQDFTNRKNITIACPVCGKLLSFTPEDGARGGCAYCMTKLMLRIEDDDFVLKPQQQKQDMSHDAAA